MLRINLLPASVALRRLAKKLFAGLFVLLIAIIAVMGLTWQSVYQQIAPMSAKADQAAADKQKVDDLNTQATAATSSIAPIQAKLDFYNAAQKYNTSYLSLYHNVFMYTSPEVLYNSMTVSGTTMTISGFTPSYSALGRFLLEMYKEPDITALALSSAIPDSASANPDTPQQVALPAGIVGHLPGYNGPITSYTVQHGHIIAVNQGGAAGGGANPFGAPQFAAPTGAGGEGKFDLRHGGFPFTVTLTLKQALVAPTPLNPNAGGGGGGAAGGGAPRPGPPSAGGKPGGGSVNLAPAPGSNENP